jgi:hypothetical protein
LLVLYFYAIMMLIGCMVVYCFWAIYLVATLHLLTLLLD